MAGAGLVGPIEAVEEEAVVLTLAGGIIVGDGQNRPPLSQPRLVVGQLQSHSALRVAVLAGIIQEDADQLIEVVRHPLQADAFLNVGLVMQAFLLPEGRHVVGDPLDQLAKVYRNRRLVLAFF